MVVDEKVFERLQNLCGKCDIYLSASKDDHRLENYVRFKPDPNAVAIDAVALS